jgi:hypothetical protein
MKYFKDLKTNTVYAYESDGSQDHVIPPDLVRITRQELVSIQAEIDKAHKAPVDVLRRDAYTTESDPLFFKWQRGECTKDQWLAKINEIRVRFPDQ